MLFGYGTSVPGGRLAASGVEVATSTLSVSVGSDVGWAISVDVTVASSGGRAIGPVAPHATRASDSKAEIHILMNDGCFSLYILMGWLSYLVLDHFVYRTRNCIFLFISSTFYTSPDAELGLCRISRSSSFRNWTSCRCTFWQPSHLLKSCSISVQVMQCSETC